MTASEFRTVRAEAIGERSPMRALLSALRTAQRRAAKVSVLPAELRTAIDRIETEVERRVESRSGWRSFAEYRVRRSRPSSRQKYYYILLA